MIWHITIPNVHLHLARHTFGAQGSHGETGSHAEEENTPIWLGQQNCGKLRIWNINHIYGKVSQIIVPYIFLAHLLKKFKWARRISLNEYVCDTK